MMSDVTVKGREAEVVTSSMGGWCITSCDLARDEDESTVFLDETGAWSSDWTEEGCAKHRLPTREAAEQFLREHADKPAESECEFCGDPATRIETFDRPVPVCDACHADRRAPASPEPVTINHPLADLIFRKCGLTQEQAVRVAEVLGEGVTLPTEPAEGRELPDSVGEWRSPNYAAVIHVYRVSTGWGPHAGELAYNALSAEGMYNVCGFLVKDLPRGSWHKAASGERSDAWNSTIDALLKCQEQLAEAQQKMDAAREDVAHLALLRNDMLKDITARDEELRRLRFAIEYASSMASDREQVQQYLRAALASPPPPRTITDDKYREVVNAIFQPGMGHVFLRRRGWMKAKTDNKYYHSDHGNILRSMVDAIGIEAGKLRYDAPPRTYVGDGKPLPAGLRAWARKIVDQTWNVATESEAVPGTPEADEIINSVGPVPEEEGK